MAALFVTRFIDQRIWRPAVRASRAKLIAGFYPQAENFSPDV
jgi:hypothetical protein